MIFDPEKNKAIQFSSDPHFTFSEAHKTVRGIRKSNAPQNLEIFDNNDYNKFELVDFRSLRYRRGDSNYATPQHIREESDDVEFDSDSES